MNSRTLQKIAWIILVVSGVTVVWLAINAWTNGYFIWGKTLEFEKTGQFGDFVGGFIGTLISASAFIFLYLTFKEQRDNFSRERFESKFFDLLKIHRENVSELNYTKYNPLSTQENKFETSDNRKVFRVIFREFIECYREVQKFARSKSENEIIKDRYRQKLESIIRPLGCRASLKDMAIIDIAYSVVFFGVSEESEPTVRKRFLKCYKEEFVFRLIHFLQMKPRSENEIDFGRWDTIRRMRTEDLTQFIDMIYRMRNVDVANTVGLSDFIIEVLSRNKRAVKYYGGHQHRLGHYYRHLFQCYKFINSNELLSKKEKYFYGKTLRAQLSTYEQFLLFINSVSSLGLKWEYLPDTKDLSGNIEDWRLITNYDLIKNLPGERTYDIIYKKYYPKVNYEAREQL